MYITEQYDLVLAFLLACFFSLSLCSNMYCSTMLHQPVTRHIAALIPVAFSGNSLLAGANTPLYSVLELLSWKHVLSLHLVSLCILTFPLWHLITAVYSGVLFIPSLCCPVPLLYSFSAWSSNSTVVSRESSVPVTAWIISVGSCKLAFTVSALPVCGIVQNVAKPECFLELLGVSQLRGHLVKNVWVWFGVWLCVTFCNTYLTFDLTCLKCSSTWPSWPRRPPLYVRLLYLIGNEPGSGYKSCSIPGTLFRC